MKPCPKCQKVLQLEDFHKNSRRKDGLETNCKTCMNAYKTAHARNPKSQLKRTLYRMSNRERQAELNKAYRERHPERVNEIQRRYRQNNRLKYLARTTLGNAIRDGKLFKLPCHVCGAKKTEAHHHDYTKPLTVTWLCKRHHEELHTITKPTP